MSNHLLTWITTLIVIAVISILAYRSQTTAPTSQVNSNTPPKEQTTLRSTQVKARINSCRRIQTDEKTLAEGYIENIGNTDLRYVTLEIQWLNRIKLRRSMLSSHQFTQSIYHFKIFSCNII